jgi:hypothetical protein
VLLGSVFTYYLLLITYNFHGFQLSFVFVFGLQRAVCRCIQFSAVFLYLACSLQLVACSCIQVLQNKLKQQRSYQINNRDGKNAFGGFVAVGIDIKSEHDDIQHQARNRNSGDQIFLPSYHIQNVFNAVGIKSNKIIGNKA